MRHPDPTSVLRAGGRRFVRGPVFLAGLIMLLGLVGCDNKRTKLSEEELAQGVRNTRGPVAPSEKIKVDPRCELNEKVEAPDENSAEWVIHELYTAAASTGDDEANFQRFYKHFDASTAEKWARDQYWPRLKTHVSKYIDGDAEVGISFTICERRQETPDSVKLFIRSKDSSKSNPPITLKKMPDGTHKIVFFTY
jgi:hypothetical protein